MLGLYYADSAGTQTYYDIEARDWLVKGLAGDLPDDLRGEAEAALASVKERLAEKGRHLRQ